MSFYSHCRSDFLSILNSIGRFPSAEEVIIKSSTSRQRVSVYKCMKLLEPHFSHSAYNMDASLTSFEDGTPQQDPYPPYRMASPTMIGRMGGSRNPVHAHKDGLHPMYQHRDDPMYQHRDDNSDSDSQDPSPPAQSRGKPGSRSASVSKERRQGTKVVSRDCVMLCIQTTVRTNLQSICLCVCMCSISIDK